jgi:hypothetical protein
VRAFSIPESRFSAPIASNCIVPGADFEVKTACAPRKPLLANEKPEDSLRPLPNSDALRGFLLPARKRALPHLNPPESNV